MLKSARVKRPLATTILRAELREGLETMPLSRPQLKIAAALAALFVLLLSSSAHAQPVDDHTITAEGIGNAVLGLSPAELIEALGPDYQVGDEVRITIDFDGRVVSRNGTVQFRAAMTDDTETLTLFMVSNPEFTTAEGIGPTSTIAEAEAVYGPAMLAWNPDNGGREFVSFANGPDGRIAFRTPGIGGTNVGIYASGEFSTSAYEDGAAIAAVWVICVSGTDCAADVATAEPTPTPEPTATPEPTHDTGSGTDSGDLPRTGATELVLTSIVSVLFAVGGALVLIERRFLSASWPTSSS